MRIRALLVGAILAVGLVAPIAAAGPPAGAAAPAIPPFAKVSTALRHSCAVSTAGAVWCWGTNTGSILGNPAAGTLAAYPVPVDVTGSALDGEVVTDLDAGVHTTCSVTSVGDVACWGGARFAGIGNGSPAATASPTSPDFSASGLAGKAVAKVEVSTTAACAISTDGLLACWGKRPGTPTLDLRPRDVDLTGTALAGKAIREVDTTGSHACAVTTDGILACWGYHEYNRIGPHATADALSPTVVDLTGSALDGKAVVDVTTDDNASCALATDGTVSCWGTGSSVFFDVPTAGTPLAGKTIVELQHQSGLTCARTSTNGVACIGSNASGRAGVSGGSPTVWTTPATAGTALSGKSFTDLSVGWDTTCLAATDGIVGCFGANSSGEGGNANCHDYLACAATYGAPTPPTVTSVVPGPRALTITWAPPASTGGSPITSYQVLVNAGFFLKTATVAGDATTVTIDGLVNGTSYNVRVTAKNALGTSDQSAATSATPAARPSTVAPFATWDAFTTQQFQDLEARAPTPAELSSWATTLGGDATQKGALVESIRRGTDNTTAVDPGVRLYRAFLGRIPDAGGLRFWVNRRRTGTWPLVRIADHFAASSEFKRKYGTLTNQQFVERIYTDVLGRTADPTGVDYWTRQLDLGRRSRGSVMVGFSESSEYKTKQADPTDVAVAYVYLLGRAPTVTEETTWVNLRKSVSHAQLIRELLDSEAYATRIAG